MPIGKRTAPILEEMLGVLEVDYLKCEIPQCVTGCIVLQSAKRLSDTDGDLYALKDLIDWCAVCDGSCGNKNMYELAKQIVDLYRD